MKKVLKIVLLAIIVILIGITSVNAEEESTATVTLVPSVSEVKKGETFTVSVLVECENGIEAVDSTLEYNKEKLNLENVVFGNGFSSLSGENSSTGLYQLSVVSSGSTEEKKVTVATITFKVLEDADVNDVLEIKLKNIEVGVANTNPTEYVEIAEEKTSVKVIEKVVEQKPETENKGEPKKDIANTKNPATGLESNLVTIIVPIVLISIVSYIKYKKYKNI